MNAHRSFYFCYDEAVTTEGRPNWKIRLLRNSRFWILTGGIVLSVDIAGALQLYVPAGSLQTIRIEQTFGFISMILLYLAILASPLTKAYPDMRFKEHYLHARRAIGVLAFYYAILHTYLTFFKQLDGFGGIKYYNHRYELAVLLGIVTLAVLFVMAATSLDWAVKTMGFKNWKLLHRLVYIASLALLVHVALVGPHYSGAGLVSTLTAVAAVVLLWLEGLRIWNLRKSKGKPAA